MFKKVLLSFGFGFFGIVLFYLLFVAICMTFSIKPEETTALPYYFLALSGLISIFFGYIILTLEERK